MLDGVSGVVVPVTNLAKAQDFYMSKLGIRNKLATDGTSYVALQSSGQAIFLLTPTPEFPFEGRPGPGAGLMFTVKDIDGTIKELKKRGVDVGAPMAGPGGQKVALFRDQDGNNLGLLQPAGKSANKRGV